MSPIQNQDAPLNFQLSEQLTRMIEESKHHSERIFDDLEMIFAVVTLDFKVLKGNVALARALQSHPELLQGRDLLRVFDSGMKAVFCEQLAQLSEVRSTVEFELPIRLPGGAEVIQAPYLWSVQRFDVGRKGERQIGSFLVLGKDISALRENERKVNELFSGIPLAILGVGRDGKVADVYSNYSYTLFSREDLENKKAIDLLFSDAREGLKASQLEALEKMTLCIGEKQLLADVFLDVLPKSVELERRGILGGKCRLGISYQPISRDGRVEKILLILEDRITRIDDRLPDGKGDGQQEDPDVVRLREIKGQSEALLQMVFSDSEVLIERLDKAVRQRGGKELRESLHGFKGLFRIAQFQILVEMVQFLEELVRQKQDGTISHEHLSSDQNWDDFRVGVDEIKSEYLQYRGLFSAVFSGFEARSTQVLDKELLRKLERMEREFTNSSRFDFPLRSLLFYERLRLLRRWIAQERLDGVRTILDEQVLRNQLALGREVKLVRVFRLERIHTRHRMAVTEVLLHLINNSFVHGLEPPEERVSAGKPLKGKIRVKISHVRNYLELSVRDDGRGIDPSRIRESVISKGLMTPGDLESMDDQAVQDLVFMPGFSTAEKTDQIAGMGVGLSAVKRRVKELNGKVRLKSNVGKGTEFIIRLPDLNWVGMSSKFYTRRALLSCLQEMCSVEFVDSKFPDLDSEGNYSYQTNPVGVILILFALSQQSFEPDQIGTVKIEKLDGGILTLSMAVSKFLGKNKKSRIQKNELEIAKRLVSLFGISTFHENDTVGIRLIPCKGLYG